jgi:hypothetical protein
MRQYNQHHHIASLQRHWAANALKDAKYNMKRAKDEVKAGNRILAAGYAQEARWDMQWRNRRLKIAKKESG